MMNPINVDASFQSVLRHLHAYRQQYAVGASILSGLLLVVAIGAVVGTATHDPGRSRSRVTRTLALPKPPTPQEVAGPHLDVADRDSQPLAAKHLATIDAFFYDTKQKSPNFAKTALGWGSKWALLTSDHEEFLRTKFAEQMFSEAEFNAVINRLVNHVLRDIDSLENRMLVAIGTDVERLPSNYTLPTPDPVVLKESFRQMVRSSSEVGFEDLLKTIVVEIVAHATGQVASGAATKMGVSAAVLGTGMCSSTVTFGVGLLAAVVIDQIITKLWDWFADPTGNLVDKLNAELDSLSARIKQSTRTALERLVKERAKLRRKTVMALLDPQNAAKAVPAH